MIPTSPATNLTGSRSSSRATCEKPRRIARRASREDLTIRESLNSKPPSRDGRRFDPCIATIQSGQTDPIFQGRRSAAETDARARSASARGQARSSSREALNSPRAWRLHPSTCKCLGVGTLYLWPRPIVLAPGLNHRTDIFQGPIESNSREIIPSLGAKLHDDETLADKIAQTAASFVKEAAGHFNRPVVFCL